MSRPEDGRVLRPDARLGPAPPGAARLAGGWCWFERAAVLERGRPPRWIGLCDLSADERERLCAPRAPLPGCPGDRPAIMGILNVTPDSFSDGGLHASHDAAIAHGQAMRDAGADLIDVGGESTRPGAAAVSDAEEVARIEPVVAALVAAGLGPVSIDTRKAAVARAALAAGATMVNDVSALSHDPDLAPLVAAACVPICLMHAQGTPETMQNDPRYDDVVIDVYEALSARVAAAERAGIPRARIVVDPGIGFGKTVAHNVTLIRDIAVFHGMGCHVLLGASRKSFIGVIGGGETPPDRVPGSVAAALWGVAHGIQLVRAHDVGATRQAISLQAALAAD